MKQKFFDKIVGIVAILLLFSSLQAQTAVNREWVNLNGIPDTVDYSASYLDASGNLYVTTNTLVAGQQANILTMKYDGDGNLIWQDTYNGMFNGKDYGTAITQDNAGNVYVAGVSQTSALSSDYILFKYDASGTLVWTANYGGNGLYNAPSAITTDNNGNIYLTGVTLSFATQTDYATVKFNNSGVQQWAATYDYVGLYEIPVGIAIDNSSGNIYVTGASASSNNNYDYATIEYNNAGTQLNINRVSAPGTGFDKAAAIKRDNTGNLYITGSAFDQSTNSYDIKTLKLNASLAVQWIKTYDDSGLEDAGISLDIDNIGNVYVGGYITNSATGKDFITLKYDVNGNELWHQTYNNSLVSEDEEIRKIDADNVGNVYVVGTLDKGNETDILMIKYDTNGEIQTVEIYEQFVNGIDKPTDIKADNSGNVYVTGKVFDGTNYQNAVVKYGILDKLENFEYNASGHPFLVKDQLIVRFDTSAIVKSTIDNINKQWGSLTDFLTQDAITELQAVIPYNTLRNTKALKIFPHFTSQPQISVSRLGISTQVPMVWATLKLLLPSALPTGGEVIMCSQLENLRSLVRYAQPEYIFSTDNSIPNDPFYSNQGGLRDSNLQGFQMVLNGANIEKAWDFGTGKDYVRVGVFDEGLWWQHPDFGSVQANIVAGYDCDYSTSIFNSPNPSPNTNNIFQDGHGTQVMGIIGALRDNSIGVAGIASGGTYANFYYDNGASMYMIKNNSLAMSEFANSIMETCKDSLGDSLQHFKLNIMNHSYSTGDANYIPLLREAIHFANRQHVETVAARGNTGDTTSRYPACIEDKWVISVGASNLSGEIAGTSTRGKKMDIIAPGLSGLVYSTHYDVVNQVADYSTFLGTSASAPIVSGTLALLLSYFNDSANVYTNLAPEDCEYLLQKSGTSANAYYDSCGYGLIDAFKTIDFLNNGKTIKHFGISTDYNTILPTKISDSTIIHLNQIGFDNKTGQVFSTGTYRAEIWKVNTTVNHNIATNQIIDYWGLHSLSNTLPLYDSISGINELNPVEDVKITYLDNYQADLEGYFYRLQDVTNGVWMGWIPTNPFNTFNPNQPPIKLHYSLYLSPGSIGIIPEKNIYNAIVSPNPATQENTIKFTLSQAENCSIDIYDIAGKKLKNVFENSYIAGENIVNSNIAGLASGVYFYRITTPKTQFNLKFIKL